MYFSKTKMNQGEETWINYIQLQENETDPILFIVTIVTVNLYISETLYFSVYLWQAVYPGFSKYIYRFKMVKNIGKICLQFQF